MSGIWTAGTNVGYSTYNPFSGGDASNAISAGGSGTATNTCREWNGSSWIGGSDLTGNRSRCSYGGCGNANNAIAAGGYTGYVIVSTSQEYNGTAWGSSASLNVARWTHTVMGNATDALMTCGAISGARIYSSEYYNGSTWTSVSNYGITGIDCMPGGGNSTDAICASGHNGTTYTSQCQSFNGSSWAVENFLTMARYEAGGGGSSTGAVIFGGRDTAITNNTEEFNGTTWGAGGNMNTARRLVGGAASLSGSDGSGISIGGFTTIVVQTVETYNITEIQFGIIRNAASNRSSSNSRLCRFAPKLLNSPPIVLTTPTYDGGGQAVHPSVVYISGGFAGYKYWMGMTPYPGGNDSYENPSIIASNDGITWEVPSGITNPLAPKPSSHNSDVCLVWDSNAETLYLYYIEKLKNLTHTLYRFPITENPLTVGSKVQCYQSASYLISPCIFCNGPGDWVMWIGDPSNIPHRLTSTDGVSWSNDTVVGVYTNGAPTKNTITPYHMSVNKINGKYLFFYASPPAGLSSANTDLYYATAEDMYAPIDFRTTKLLSEFSDRGTRQVYHSDLVQMENGTYRLYISASTTENVWRIGYSDVVLW